MPIYSEDFYINRAESTMYAAQQIVPLLIDIFQPSSVQDFGCGDGVWLAEFSKYGVSKIAGYDINTISSNSLLVDLKQITQNCNFCAQSFSSHYQSDLALSLEVAEHLPLSKARNFVKNLTKSSSCICFSAAIPAQGGGCDEKGRPFHVNEQSRSFWANLFLEENYIAFDPIRPKIFHNTLIPWWYRQNIFIYIQKDFLEHSAIAEKVCKYPASETLGITFVNEDLLERLYLAYQWQEHLRVPLLFKKITKLKNFLRMIYHRLGLKRWCCKTADDMRLK